MKSKQTQLNNKVGLYMRLSKDDERNGESLSIENQRIILTKYVNERNWTITDEYIDDGYSGTNFERPEVQRLLEDAKTGRIDTIIVKDLSRFGRNYIFVGQYVDYIFPTYGIRFIAISDNVDTANTNSSGMDMMPIMNVFNEWHSANTSKKIRSVFEANAKAGKYMATHAPYGYVKGTDEKKLPVIDEPAAKVVKRIFEMRASGKKIQEICNVLNNEKIPIPADYLHEKFGVALCIESKHMWVSKIISNILTNPMYVGTLVRLKKTTVSYKNKTRIKREPLVFPNAVEPIISQELWYKCKEMEMACSHGKHTKSGFIAPLSGLMYCADCGGKMRLGYAKTRISKKHPEQKTIYHFGCGDHSRLGKQYCFNHNIKLDEIESIVLEDIRLHAKLVLENEEKARDGYLKLKEQVSISKTKADKKALAVKQRRYDELDRLIQATYEDKVLGKVPENVCLKLLAKYTEEQQSLLCDIDLLEETLAKVMKNEDDVDEFIRRVKQYETIPKLTRSICLELIDKITIGAPTKDSTEPREIQIFYKFLNNN